MNNRKLLTPAEVAELLGIKEETLRKWRSTKRYSLRWTKIGRNVMYRREDVECFIDARTVSA